MKTLKLFLVGSLLAAGLASCASVQVATDYDKTVDFDQYKTFAFYKPGIDSAQISDLDKRRILRAIDTALTAKGMTKAKEPDLLVSIFTESTENVNVHQNYYGWGGYYYNPWYWGYAPYYPYYGMYNHQTSRSSQGTLYIDFIDGKERTLVWEGVGKGAIKPEGSVDEKIDNINEIVSKILAQYPPGAKERKKKK